MKVSIIGPTNMKKFSKILGKPETAIQEIAQKIGEQLGDHDLVVVFNYSGMLQLIGEAYKKKGGKIEMLYTENDYDWAVQDYLENLDKGDITTKKESWHDMLLSLVSDSDVVVCAGLSSGVFAELCYMKWNHQDKKGNVKKLIGIKELLRDGKFPPEFEYDMKDLITVCSVEELSVMI